MYGDKESIKMHIQENLDPKVSVVTVCFNSASTIEQTIQSVISQTYYNIEYIIIDGGSTDGTLDIVNKYKDKIAYFVSEQDHGIYDAMNKGIQAATGEYIGIINSDDWFESNAVELFVNTFRTHLNTDIVCGDMIVYWEQSGVMHTRRASSDVGLHTLEKTMSVLHPTMFVKKSFYQKYGVFDTSFKVAADYDLALRAGMNKVVFTYIPHILAHFRLNGVSSQVNFSIIMERAKARRNNDVEMLLQMKYLIQEIFIHCIRVSIPQKFKNQLRAFLWNRK